MRILLVEDDTMLGESLQRGLTQSGHAVDWLRDGDSADSAVRAQQFDMVLLDLGLPKQDGLAVLKQMRRRNNAVPVIILTAREALPDRVAGLDSGADDYLIKPFALDELEARMRSVERRHTGTIASVLQYGELTLNPITHEVRHRDELVVLSAREYQILHALMRRPGAIISRANVEEQVYSWDQEIDSNAIEVHIHRLRQKLNSTMIRTVRGLGYQLVAE
ncbi:MAG: basR [Verrucomicrobiaceae bacterium]|nr:basR [Verrucomicrobiaceae bacterium]